MKNNQCGSINQFYQQILGNGSLSEIEVLRKHAIKQFHCFRDASENKQEFNQVQQVKLKKWIQELLVKSKPADNMYGTSYYFARIKQSL